MAVELLCETLRRACIDTTHAGAIRSQNNKRNLDNLTFMQVLLPKLICKGSKKKWNRQIFQEKHYIFIRLFDIMRRMAYFLLIITRESAFSAP